MNFEEAKKELLGGRNIKRRSHSLYISFLEFDDNKIFGYFIRKKLKHKKVKIGEHILLFPIITIKKEIKIQDLTANDWESLEKHEVYKYYVTKKEEPNAHN